MRTNRPLSLLLLLSLLLHCLGGCASPAAAPCVSPAASATPAAETAPEEATASAAPSPSPKESPATSLERLSAYASANLSTGGFAVSDGSSLFVAADGLWRMDLDGQNPTLLLEGDFGSLNLYQDKLYFLALGYAETEWGYLALSSQQPFSMNLDGSDLQPLGEALPVGSQEVYAFESEDGSSSYDSQLGYRGFTVHEGWAYYLATEPGEGSYSIVFDDEEMAEPEPVLVRHQNQAALKRLSLTDGQVETLAEGLGNAEPVFTLEGGRLYYTRSLHNPLYPYDFTDYLSCSLDGSQQETVCPPPQDSLLGYHVDGEGYQWMDIVNHLQVMDGQLYASLNDSEGDFRDSRLMRLDESGESLLVYEMYYLPSLATPAGLLYAGGERDWEEDRVLEHGLYLLEDGQARLLLPLSEQWNGFVSSEMNLVEGWAYLRRRDLPLLRLRLADGAAEQLEDGAWVQAQLTQAG